MSAPGRTVSTFLRAALGYGLASLASSLLTFLLLPLYTRLLSPADYGVIDVVSTVTTLLVTLVVFGVDHALSAFFFDGDDDYRRRLGGTVLWTTLSAGFLAWAAQVLAAPALAGRLFGDPGLASFFYLTSLQVLVGPLALVLTALYRLRVRVLQVNLISLLSVVGVLVGNLVFVALLGYGALGVALATGAAYAVAMLALLVIARSELRAPFDRRLVGPLYRAAAGLLPATLSWLLILNIDRILLTQYVSFDDLGRYSLANKLATMLYVVFTIVWGAWSPIALGMARDPRALQRYADAFELFTVGALGLALGLGLFTPELVGLISRAEFQSAAPYALALMAFTGPMTMMSACFNLLFFVHKRTYLLSVVNISAAAVNIGLNLILGPRLGVWGAVLATLAAGLTALAVGLALSRRLDRVPYRWSRILPLLALYAGLVAAFALQPAPHPALKAAALALFAAAVALSGALPLDLLRQEIARLRARTRETI